MRARLRNRPAGVAKPDSEKLEPTPHPLRSEDEVNLTAKLVRNEVANCARSKTDFAGSDDGGAIDLLPFEHHTRRVTVRPSMPTDRHAPLVGRERAILCRVGGELMEH